MGSTKFHEILIIISIGLNLLEVTWSFDLKANKTHSVAIRSQKHTGVQKKRQISDQSQPYTNLTMHQSNPPSTNTHRFKFGEAGDSKPAHNSTAISNLLSYIASVNGTQQKPEPTMQVGRKKSTSEPEPLRGIFGDNSNKSTVFNVLILSNQLSLTPFVKNCHGDPDEKGQSQFLSPFSDQPLPTIKNTTVVFMDAKDQQFPFQFMRNNSIGTGQGKKKLDLDELNLDLNHLRDLVKSRRRPFVMDNTNKNRNAIHMNGAYFSDESGRNLTDLTENLTSDDGEGTPEYQEIAQFHGRNSSILLVRINGRHDKNRGFFGAQKDALSETEKAEMEIKLDSRTRQPTLTFKNGGKRERPALHGGVISLPLGSRPTARTQPVMQENDKNITDVIQEMETHLSQLSKLMERMDRKRKLSEN